MGKRTSISAIYVCWGRQAGGSGVMMIDTPFRFADGDDIPANVELGLDLVRFFDDGDVFDHFAGLGIPMKNDAETQYLSAIAQSHGLFAPMSGMLR